MNPNQTYTTTQRVGGNRLFSVGKLLLKLLLPILLLLYLGASFYLAATAGDGNREVPQRPQAIGAHYENVAFTSRVDKVQLRGWLFHADHPNGRSVVFVHGHGGTRTDSNNPKIAHDELNHGYDTLLFDMRGSGESDGTRQTLATEEPRDVLGAYDFMRSRGYAPPKMTVYGDSMGAATVIESAPELNDVSAIVADSAYAYLNDILQEQWSSKTHLPGFTAVVGENLGRFFGIDPYLAPANVVRNLPNRAFLFFHARYDNLVPEVNSEELKQASLNPDSQLVVFPGHSHLDTYRQDPQRYMTTLYAFIDQQTRANGG